MAGMRRGGVSALLAVAVAVALAAPASAATFTVDVKDFEFSPRVVSGRAGESVSWQKPSGTFPHNVRSTQGIFRSGNATSNAFTFTRTFSAGTYPYRCEIHDEMTGRVRIRPRIATAPDGLPFTVRWATPRTNTGTAFRVHYRVGGGSWRMWISSTTGKARVFGANNKPVRVVDNRTYRFRVRSTLAGAASGFSPAVAYTP